LDPEQTRKKFCLTCALKGTCGKFLDTIERERTTPHWGKQYQCAQFAGNFIEQGRKRHGPYQGWKSLQPVLEPNLRELACFGVSQQGKEKGWQKEIGGEKSSSKGPQRISTVEEKSAHSTCKQERG